MSSRFPSTCCPRSSVLSPGILTEPQCSTPTPPNKRLTKQKALSLPFSPFLPRKQFQEAHSNPPPPHLSLSLFHPNPLPPCKRAQFFNPRNAGLLALVLYEIHQRNQERREEREGGQLSRLSPSALSRFPSFPSQRA